MRSFSVFGVMSFISTALFSLPQNMEVVSGKAQMVQKEGSLLIETSDHAILQFSNFDIQTYENVHFTQPSTRSTVLSRITSEYPSQILGSLTSNGQVFLINPHGVYFGKESVVEVGSIVVSTLDIKNEDFLDKKYHFQLGEKFGSILNDGLIRSTEGSIVLLAPLVENRGEIKAVLGSVLIASAEHVAIDFTGDGLMKFALEGALQESMLNQYGQVEAEIVSMKLGRAKKVISDVVNHEGITEAEVFVEENGTIYFAPLSHIQAKKIEIEGSNLQVESSMQAPDVKLIGKTIRLEGANIDASTASEGGIVLIGGGFQGKGPIPYAKEVVMDESSVIKANALENGDGGLVVLWSEDATIFNGKIEAKGGALSGNGGVIETSSHHNLGGFGTVYTDAPLGDIGLWLLDPDILIIETSGTSLLESDCGTSGTLSISSTSVSNSDATVTLNAKSQIYINDPIIMSHSKSGLVIACCSTSNTKIYINTDMIKTTAGGITLAGGSAVLNENLVIASNNGSASGANISLDFISGISAPSGATLSIQAGTSGSIIINGSLGNDQLPLGSLSLGGASVQMRSVYTNGTPLNLSLPIKFTSDSVLKTNGAAITLGSISNYVNLTVDSGVSDITFTQNISGLKNVSCKTTGTLTMQGFSADSFVLNCNECKFFGAIESKKGDFSASGQVTTSELATFSIAGTFSQIGNQTFSSGGATLKANSISIESPIHLLKNLSLDTSGSNGAILLSDQVDGSFGLTLNSGSGNMTFNGIIDVAEIVINNVGSATFKETVSAGSFTQTSGSGSTTWNDQLSVLNVLSLTGNNFNFYGEISTPVIYTNQIGKLNIYTSSITSPDVISFIGNTALYTDLSLTSNLISLWGNMDGNLYNLSLTSPTITAKNIGTSSSYIGTLTLDTTLLTVEGIYSTDNLDLSLIPIELFTSPSVLKTSNGGIIIGNITPNSFNLTLSAKKADVSVMIFTQGSITLSKPISNLGNFVIEDALSVRSNNLSANSISWKGGEFSLGGTTTTAQDLIIENNGTLTISNSLVVGGAFKQVGTGDVLFQSESLVASGKSADNVSILFSSPITFEQNLLCQTTANQGDIVFEKAVNGFLDLQVYAPTGTVSFQENLGSSEARIKSVTTSGINTNIMSIYSESVDFSKSPTTLLGSSIIDVHGGSAIFSDIFGGYSLNVIADLINIGGSIGSLDVPLMSLDLTGDAFIESSLISTLNNQTYHNPLVMISDITFSTIQGDLLFEDSITGADTSISCTLGSGSLTTLGSVDEISNFTVTNSGNCSLNTVSAVSLVIQGGAPTIIFNGDLNLMEISVDGGPLYFGASITAESIYARSFGNMSNVTNPVSITASSLYFDANKGVIGSYTNPISVIATDLITIGANPRADFIGSFPNQVKYVSSNTPCIVTLNGFDLKNCTIDSTPQQSFELLSKTYFYLPGVYSSWDNFSDEYYFKPQQIHLETEEIALFWERNVAFKQKKIIVETINVAKLVLEPQLEEIVELSFENHLTVLKF